MDAEIRCLEPSDAAAFRDLRLAALHGEPTAFRASPEEEPSDIDRWSERLQDSDVFGAWRGGELVWDHASNYFEFAFGGDGRLAFIRLIADRP